MMSRIWSVAALCVAACSWVAPAAAQGIYRCGDSYSQQPCAGGTLVQAEDARSAGQGAQTRLAAQRDAKTADAMEKARLKEEAKPAQAIIPPPKVQDTAAKAGTAVSAKAKKPAHFTAISPKKPGDSSAKKKKNAKKKAA